MNDGKCSQNDNATGGYECVCPSIFEGKNCEMDVNECTEEGTVTQVLYTCMTHIGISCTDPCLAGSCTNDNGGFSCSCPADRTGHRCQYQIRCDDNVCSNETTCVETLVNINGYVCDSTPDDMTVIVSLNDGVTLHQLDEEVYDLVSNI